MAERISVKKTYKMYVGGKFPRSESGQTFAVLDRKGASLAACAKASKKDFRDAVLAAASGLRAWDKATGYLKGQILYRAAEMLQGREAQFVEELQAQGMGRAAARREVAASIDRLVYHAGWTDKIGQVYSTVNPVATPHFCFTTPEPTGIVAILLDGQAGLLAMIEASCRVLAGGNSGILLSGKQYPMTASSLGEIWQTSDLPAGALNILTGPLDELIPTVAGHRHVDGILCAGLEGESCRLIQETAADSLKRLAFVDSLSGPGSPEGIRNFLEMKTTWHPVAF